MKRFVLSVLALAAEAVGIGSVSAQSVVTDPAVISGCLCDGQGVALLRDRIDQAQQTYDQDRANLDALDQQIRQASASVNVAIAGQLDAVRSLNVRRQQLYARIYDVDLPAVQAAVRSYNDAAGQYAAACAGRSFDSVQMSQMQASLSCPPPVQ